MQSYLLPSSRSKPSGLGLSSSPTAAAGPVRIGIIGTAGRGEDGAKMTTAIYDAMIAYVRHQQQVEWRLPNSRVILISGGSAWSDHVAVTLFLRAKENGEPYAGLVLYFPCALVNSESGSIGATAAVDNGSWKWQVNPGRLLNQVHQPFSQKVGWTTMNDFKLALSCGAQFSFAGKGFHPRNKLVAAASDRMIAFTWGADSTEPKEGGTKFTWDHCKAPIRIHVPLSQLQTLIASTTSSDASCKMSDLSLARSNQKRSRADQEKEEEEVKEQGEKIESIPSSTATSSPSASPALSVFDDFSEFDDAPSVAASASVARTVTTNRRPIRSTATAATASMDDEMIIEDGISRGSSYRGVPPTKFAKISLTTKQPTAAASSSAAATNAVNATIDADAEADPFSIDSFLDEADLAKKKQLATTTQLKRPRSTEYDELYDDSDDEADERSTVANMESTNDELKRASSKLSTVHETSHSSMSMNFLIHSTPYVKLLDSQSVHMLRMHYFASLLHTFRATTWPNLRILPPRRASRRELETFHSKAYLDFIETVIKKFARNKEAVEEKESLYGAVEQLQELTPEEEAKRLKYGLLDDCPITPELYELIAATVGSTLKAIESICEAHSAHPLAPITAMNFGGGRHHSRAECATGFCFCNDVVIGILKLLSSTSHFPRVLYLDIDLHHGDAVEEAFAASSSVITCSFHHYAPGFFPGTGALKSGRDSAINIPLREGIDDATYCSMFDTVLSIILPSFQPSVVVMCCGVDGLATDRMSPFNLTTRAYGRCVQLLKKRLGHYPVTASTPITTSKSTTSASISRSTSTSSNAASFVVERSKTDAVDITPISSTIPIELDSSSTLLNQPSRRQTLDSTTLVSAAPTSDSIVESSLMMDSSPHPVTMSSTGPEPMVLDSPAPSPPSSTTTMQDVTFASSTSSSSSNLDVNEVANLDEVIATPISLLPVTTESSTTASRSAPSPPIPLLLVGGGGYNPHDSARAFLIMAATACGVKLPPKIPDHDQYYTDYMSTHFDLHSSTVKGRVNQNDRAYLQTILQHVKLSCKRWKAKEESEGMEF